MVASCARLKYAASARAQSASGSWSAPRRSWRNCYVAAGRRFFNRNEGTAPPPEQPALKKLGPTHADQPSERFRSRVAVRRRDLAHRSQGTGTDVGECPDVLPPRVPRADLN